MHLFNQINPSKEQFKHLLQTFPSETPICMLNLIKYREKVPEMEASGKELYERYMMNVMHFLRAAKGRLLWKGVVSSTLIGDDKDQPHLVFIVRYPDVDHFRNMLQDPEYQKITNDRTLALEYGGLIALEEEYWDGN